MWILATDLFTSLFNSVVIICASEAAAGPPLQEVINKKSAALK
jgi:hypothetical protein